MECPTCQFNNREEAIFCRKCGASIVQDMVCRNCGATHPSTSRFCDKCGQSLNKPANDPEPHSYTPKFLADQILTHRSSIEGERKNVTVLFADVADFTALSEKLDPEDVHQIMDGCFQILLDEVHTYEGTINQFTGDGVMALFGAPISHEDHARRACHAALSIQNALESYHETIKRDHGVEFKMRIGLNSGPVIVGSIGDDLRMDYTAVGNTVNLAARMEGHAKPGRVLVSNNTNKITRDFFEFGPLEKISVKGMEEPQEAFELIKKGHVDTRFGASAAKGLTRFVGRKNSRAVLMKTYDKLKSGAGQVVGVVGEAGVGKSRFIFEICRHLPQNDVTLLEGRCLHYGHSIAYLPILDILKRYFDIKEGDPEMVIKAKMENKILHLDERLKFTLTPFQELLSVTVDHQDYLQLDPVVKKIRKFEAIKELLIRESQIKPLIIILEDLHWIDRTSAECIQYLIESTSAARVMLILLYRPEYIHPWGNKTGYTQISLDQLDTDSSVELVQAILKDGRAVPDIQHLVLSKAGGNPLFVEEITHSLIENGLIEKREQGYVLTRTASEIDVPDTIQGIIAARLDRVEESLKRIMQVASVIGREFAFRILQSISGMKEDLKSCLHDLQGLEFIYEKQILPELEYIFKHALTQEVAYDSLLHKRKKGIHEKIGHVIEMLYAERLEEYYEVLAYHYERSDNKDKTVEYLDLANRKAANATAMEDARDYFYKAMQILDTLPDSPQNRERRISLLVNQVLVFEQLFQFSEYYSLLTRYEPLLMDLKNMELKAGFYTRMGICELEFGSFDKSIDSSSKAIDFSEEAGNFEYASFGCGLMQWSYYMKGDYDNVFALKENIHRMTAKRFNLFAIVRSFCATSTSLAYCGRIEEAIKEGQNALYVAQQYSDNGHISFAASAITLASIFKRDFKQAFKYGEMAVKAAPSPWYEAVAQCMLANVYCRVGKFDKGIGMLDFYFQIFQSSNIIIAEIPTSSQLSEGYLLKGDYDKAEQTAKEALKVAERYGAKYFMGWDHLVIGEVSLSTNYSQAQQHIDKCITIFKEIKAENMLARAYAAFGKLYKRQGDFAQAKEYFTKALSIFTRLGTLIDPDQVKQELADLPPVEAQNMT